MRELQNHKINGLKESVRIQRKEPIKIQVMDEPGEGGACRKYRLVGEDREDWVMLLIQFQDGPVGKVGVNGITNEALLAIVEDRLAGFQAGRFACLENSMALDNVRAAMHALKYRTRDRIIRGVEGQNVE